MGGISSIACCIGNSACSLCCKCLPSVRSSTSTRMAYGTVLLTASLASWIMQSKWIQQELAKIPTFATEYVNEKCGHEDCLDQYVGILAAFRVLFAVSLFFFIMSLFLIGVDSGQDCRAGIHTGWWIFKLIPLAGFLVMAFFIPNEFFYGYQYVAMAGASVFILIQLVLVIDFAYTWSEYWIRRFEETDRNEWMCLIVSSVFLMFGGSIAGTVLMFLFYTGPGSECDLNKFFVSFNLILNIILTAIACLPQFEGGLLTSSVISIYITYLTWSAVSNEPRGDTACKPYMGDMYSNDTAVVQIFGGIFALVSVVYSSVKYGGSKTGLTLDPKDEDDVALLDPASSGDGAGSSDPESHRQEVIDDEQEGVVYSYSQFHFVFSVAAVYVIQLFTQWQTIDDPAAFEPDSSLGRGWAPVWIKIVSSWLCAGLYMWTLVAPLVMPDRF